jgi:hypothetical protein
VEITGEGGRLLYTPPRPKPHTPYLGRLAHPIRDIYLHLRLHPQNSQKRKTDMYKHVIDRRAAPGIDSFTTKALVPQVACLFLAGPFCL